MTLHASHNTIGYAENSSKTIHRMNLIEKFKLVQYYFLKMIAKLYFAKKFFSTQ